MPYTLEYRETDGGVITTYSGKVTEDEYRQCLKEKFLLGEKSMSHEKMGAPRYSISDFADVTAFDVSVEAVKYSANLSQTIMKTNETGLMAVVAPNDHEFGMGRLWQAYIGSQGERAKIFRSKEEASSWIAQTLLQNDKEA